MCKLVYLSSPLQASCVTMCFITFDTTVAHTTSDARVVRWKSVNNKNIRTKILGHNHGARQCLKLSCYVHINYVAIAIATQHKCIRTCLTYPQTVQKCLAGNLEGGA